MPELPEVETMCRGIASVVGSRVVAVERPRCRLRPIEIAPHLRHWSRRVPGQTIAAIRRAGKRVVIQLASSDAIVIEPRMTGLVLVAEPPNRTHLRLRMLLEGGPAAEILFWDRRGLGKVRLVSPAEFHALYGEERLGPDALEISLADLRRRLGSSRRAIKVALLDQKGLAGVGNLYASEILHLARVNPARSCDQVSLPEWRRMHAAMRKVLERAVICEGSTLSDGTYRNALNESGDYQNHHRVYDKADLPCSRCGQGIVQRIVQAQRATFFCPVCQPVSLPASVKKPR